MTPNTLTTADALTALRQWLDGCVSMCITSPPYWGLRAYLPKGHADKDKELGSEPTIEEYIAKQVEVFREVRRVLKDWGTLWVNMGDSYAGGAGRWGKYPENCKQRTNKGTVFEQMPIPPGLKEKDLCGVPWTLAMALRDDGWYLRDDIIWVKAWSLHDCGAAPPIEIVEQGLWGEEYRQTIEPAEKNYVGSTMPESVSGWSFRRHKIKIKKGTVSRRGQQTACGALNEIHNPTALWRDCPGCPKCEATGGYVLRKGAGRPTKAHEYLFLFSKSPAYYFDNEAVKENHSRDWTGCTGPNNARVNDVIPGQSPHRGLINATPSPSVRNLRDCWCINPQPFGDKYCANCQTTYESLQYKRLKSITIKGEDGKEIEKKVCRKCGAYDSWISHYATFPEKLVEPCIKAGTSERGNCPNPNCGMPWARVMQASPDYAKKLGTWTPDTDADKDLRANIGFAANAKKEACCSDYQTIAWRASCPCNAGEPVPAVVLDPYMGTATTAIVAERLGRNWAGIELNPEYVAIAARRMAREKEGMLK